MVFVRTGWDSARPEDRNELGRRAVREQRGGPLGRVQLRRCRGRAGWRLGGKRAVEAGQAGVPESGSGREF